MVKLESADMVDGCALVITIVYVFLVVPFCAVEIKLNVFAPTTKGKFADAAAEAIAVPFNVRVAVASVAVGVIVKPVVV